MFVNIEIKTFGWQVRCGFESYLLSAWMAQYVESPPAVNPFFFNYGQGSNPINAFIFIV